MRILHIVHSRTFAGTERHIIALSRELQRMGHEVVIAAPRAAEGLQAAAGSQGLPIIDEGSALGEKRLEVVHCHDGRSALVGAAVAARSGGIFVRTQHFLRPASIDRAQLSRVMSLTGHRLLNRRLDGYICVSHAAAEAVRGRRDHRGPVSVIPAGVDVPDPVAWGEHVAARAQSTRPLVVSAGRLEDERSFDTLVRAIPQVLRVHPTCEFMIAGDGASASQLRELARALGISQAIRWPGWVPDLQEALGDAHLYVNTWPDEGFGMATAEAMAAGMPVVVPTTGAAPELIAGGVGGWAVPPRDHSALARTLSEVLADRSRLARVGEQARERAATMYSLEAAAAAVARLYSLALARRGGGLPA